MASGMPMSTREELPMAGSARPAIVPATEEGFAAYLGALSWARLAIDAIPMEASHLKSSSQARNGLRVGFLAHSLIGLGLRETACREPRVCAHACAQPHRCAYGGVIEPRAGSSGLPLERVARIPPAYAVDAGWEAWEAGGPLRFAIYLFGRAAGHASSVTAALEAAFGRGVGPDRTRMESIRCTLTAGHLADQHAVGLLSGDASAGARGVRLELRSPLRLVRRKQAIKGFCLSDLVRDLNFRVAVWGAHHQGLPWAPCWPFLAADAQAARVVADDTRWVTFTRYSATQRRAIPLGGLVGTVTLAGVSPRLIALLGAGAVAGGGKGGAIGLGRFDVQIAG
jgi:hypothetical protein